MQIMNADLFEIASEPSQAICITTNGIIRKDGRAVMGRGVALAADKRFNLAFDLAWLLKANGNHVFDLGLRRDSFNNKIIRVISFPTKHHWKDDSDLDLIKQSAFELKALCDNLGINKCFLPRPGCANGRLAWPVVKSVIEPILDNRFVIADLAFGRR